MKIKLPTALLLYKEYFKSLQKYMFKESGSWPNRPKPCLSDRLRPKRSTKFHCNPLIRFWLLCIETNTFLLTFWKVHTFKRIFVINLKWLIGKLETSNFERTIVRKWVTLQHNTLFIKFFITLHCFIMFLRLPFSQVLHKDLKKILMNNWVANKVLYNIFKKLYIYNRIKNVGHTRDNLCVILVTDD